MNKKEHNWAHFSRKDKENIPVSAEDWYTDTDIIGHEYQCVALDYLIKEYPELIPTEVVKEMRAYLNTLKW